MTHPRRAYIDPLLELLRGIEAVGGPTAPRVYEAPVAAIDGKKQTFPAIAVNPRRESLVRASQDGTQDRTLEVAVVVAGRSLAECDDVADEVEDLVAVQAPAFELGGTEFGAEIEGQERPFFFVALAYSLRYATRKAGG